MALATPVSSSRLRKTKTFGSAGTLAAMTHPAMRRSPSIGNAAEFAGFVIPDGFHAGAVIGHGVRADRHVRCRGNRPPAALRYSWDAAGIWCRAQVAVEQRAGMTDGAFDLPERIAAMKVSESLEFSGHWPRDLKLATRIQRANFRQRVQFIFAQFGDAMDQIIEWK